MRKFDSKEELYFSWWLDELKAEGYVLNYTNEMEAIQLSEPVQVDYIKPMKKVADKHLKQTVLKPSVYTPDFAVDWDVSAFNLIVQDLKSGKVTAPLIHQRGGTFIETKGKFDMNGKTAQTNLKIKFAYQRHGVFVNLVKIPNFFKQTFTPYRYLTTDWTNKPRKINHPVRLLAEYLQTL